MDAVAEPHLLNVLLESLEVGAFAVAVVCGVDVFKRMAKGQVGRAVLIPKYVASPKGCFREIVDEGFLIHAQAVEIGHLIAQHFDVGESVGRVVESGVGGLLGRARPQSCSGGCSGKNA